MYIIANFKYLFKLLFILYLRINKDSLFVSIKKLYPKQKLKK